MVYQLLGKTASGLAGSGVSLKSITVILLPRNKSTTGKRHHPRVRTLSYSCRTILD